MTNEEKILATVPILKVIIPGFFNYVYILCFTKKRLIGCYYGLNKYSHWQPVSYEKKLIKKELEIKNFKGDIQNIVTLNNANFVISFEDIENVRFLSIFFIRVRMKEEFVPKVFTFDYALNNRKYVKSLFCEYLLQKMIS